MVTWLKQSCTRRNINIHSHDVTDNSQSNQEAKEVQRYLISLMFDQPPEGKDFLEVNSSRPLLPPSTFIHRADNKAGEMLPVLLRCPLLAASTTSNAPPSPPKMKLHSFTLIAFCFGHAQTPAGPRPQPPIPRSRPPRASFQLGLFVCSVNLMWFLAETERANVLQSLLIPTGVLAGVRFIRLSSVEAARD